MTENIFEEIMVEKSLNLRQEIENYVQEVQRSSDSVSSDIYLKTHDRDKVVAQWQRASTSKHKALGSIPSMKEIQLHTPTELSKAKDRECGEQHKNDQSYAQEIAIRLLAGFLAETLQAKVDWGEMFNIPKGEKKPISQEYYTQQFCSSDMKGG